MKHVEMQMARVSARAICISTNAVARMKAPALLQGGAVELAETFDQLVVAAQPQHVPGHGVVA